LTTSEKDREKARELVSREYGKDHPAARSPFTVTFRTTTLEHQLCDIAQALAEARREGFAECREAAARLVDAYDCETDEYYDKNAREAAHAIRALEPDARRKP
jgi:hypothetical protein